MSAAEIAGLPFALRHNRSGQDVPADLGGPGHEILFLLAGSGTLAGRDGGARNLAPGDAVVLADGGGHVLTPAAGTELEYVSLTWRDGRQLPMPDKPSRSFDRDEMTWSYEMYLQGLYSAQDIPGLPFGSVFGSVPPGTTSKPHCHQDGEIFVALGGRAEVLVDGQVSELGRGDMIFLPPFRTHAIRNSSDEPFDLVSVYWEDIDTAAAALAASGVNARPGRTLVFCPPVTPNGGLHLGHLSGPYLRADLYARAVRGGGADALVITGTDDHQSFVATTAHRQGRRPEAVAAEAGAQIAATLAAVDADVAHLYRPSHDEDLDAEVRRLFAVLATSPAVSSARVDTPWCEHCDQSLFQSFAHGRCRHCTRASDGEICEACGKPGNASELLDLTCAQCGAAPRRRPEETLHLDLGAYAEPLRQYLANVQGGGGPRQLATEVLDGGLGAYRLTRRSRWGLAVADSDDQVIDPWVELALTQIVNNNRFSENGSAANVTVLGFDNTFFYLVLLPIVCFALGMESALPGGFISNRFLHLDDEKFSTSRRHVVWADDLLGELPVDLVRLALLRRSPEEEVRSVSAAEIQEFGSDPLIERLDEWITTLRALPGDGEVPGTGAWTVHHRAFYRSLCILSEEFEQLASPDTFSSVAYVEKLESMLRDLARFHSIEQARRKISVAQEEARTSVALEYLATKAFAAFVAPVMPAAGSILWRSLGLAGAPVRERYPSFIPGGTRTSFTSLISEALWAGHAVSGKPRERNAAPA